MSTTVPRTKLDTPDVSTLTIISVREMRWVALYALPSTLLELTYIYLRQGVLRDVCLFVCLSVSNITQKVVDEFQGI